MYRDQAHYIYLVFDFVDRQRLARSCGYPLRTTCLTFCVACEIPSGPPADLHTHFGKSGLPAGARRHTLNAVCAIATQFTVCFVAVATCCMKRHFAKSGDTPSLLQRCTCNCTRLQCAFPPSPLKCIRKLVVLRLRRVGGLSNEGIAHILRILNEEIEGFDFYQPATNINRYAAKRQSYTEHAFQHHGASLLARSQHGIQKTGLTR